MPKSKHRKNPKPRFTRSDIPYADRMLMEKFHSTAEHRDDAAGKALKIALIALNDTPGVNLGYERLIRFVETYHKVSQDYYNDRPDIGDADLDSRLEKMGFLVRDGKIYMIEDDNGNIAGKGYLAKKLAKTGDYTQEGLDKLGITEAQMKRVMEVQTNENP